MYRIYNTTPHRSIVLRCDLNIYITYHITITHMLKIPYLGYCMGGYGGVSLVYN